MNRNKLLIGVAVTIWFGVTAERFVDARQAGTQTPPAKPAPAQPPPSVSVAAQPAPLPPGYAGTDTCVVCHDPEGQSITHSRHGQAKDPRSPAATLGCESCHGPGQAHVDDDAKGHIKKFKDTEAGRSQRDLPHLPQPRHSRRLGMQHARRAQPVVHHLPQRAHAAVGAEPAEEADRDAGLRGVSPAAGDQDRARRGAHAGARRQDVVLARATTRTARSATSRI